MNRWDPEPEVEVEVVVELAADDVEVFVLACVVSTLVLVSEEVCKDDDVGMATIVEVALVSVLEVAIISVLELACVEEAAAEEEGRCLHVFRFLSLLLRTEVSRDWIDEPCPGSRVSKIWAWRRAVLKPDSWKVGEAATKGTISPTAVTVRIERNFMIKYKDWRGC